MSSLGRSLHAASYAVLLAVALGALDACGSQGASNGLASAPALPQAEKPHASNRPSGGFVHPPKGLTRFENVRAAAGSTPIADEALQAGFAYPKREYWTYKTVDIDPSCGRLKWYYSNTLPGISATFAPQETGLKGETYVSFSKIPRDNPPIGVYDQVVGATCTNPSATGLLPEATYYTIAIVSLDIGQVPQVQADPKIVTWMTFKPVVGQFIELKAVTKPEVKLRKVEWTIPGDIVKSYTESKTSASYTQLPADELQQQQLQFYWIHGTNGGSDLPIQGVFPVYFTHCVPGECTGGEDFWGAVQAKATADVLAPTGVTMQSATSRVFVGRNPNATCGFALSFGVSAGPGDPTWCVHADTPGKGITWHFTATAPEGGTGSLDATQLVLSTDTMTPLPKATPPIAPPPTSTSGFALDTCIHFGDHLKMHQTVNANESATWWTSDSPGGQLFPSWQSLERHDTFTTYFVYRPDDQDGAPTGRSNIWVPLGVMDWNWSGTATNAGTPASAKWSLTQESWLHNPAGSARNLDLPTWTSYIGGGFAEECPPDG
jgi:hypothetical protein